MSREPTRKIKAAWRLSPWSWSRQLGEQHPAGALDRFDRAVHPFALRVGVIAVPLVSPIWAMASIAGPLGRLSSSAGRCPNRR
jgi:hypothetical protein